MNLATIALKNLKRNFSFYSLYLMSVSFVLMVYFCFTSFSLNEIIMEKISSDGRVEMMCSVVAVFIMVFVVFYMFYSNNFFMRRRMKELGIYALLGYRKGDMLCLLTIENIFVCLGGTIVGILAGSLLHIGVTAGIVALLDLTIDMGAIPFINPQAVGSIFLFILAVLLTLTLSNAVLLLKSTLLDLVRLEKKVEKPVRPNIVFSIIGIVFLLGGYALALDMVRGTQSVWTTIGFSPIALLTLVLVVIGTVLRTMASIPMMPALAITSGGWPLQMNSKRRRASRINRKSRCSTSTRMPGPPAGSTATIPPCGRPRPSLSRPVMFIKSTRQMTRLFTFWAV